MVTTTSHKAPRQVVFAFDEGATETITPEIRGGKGANLAEMVAMGLPVPPGYTIATSLARAFMQEGRLPRRFDWQFTRGIQGLERATGRRLGDDLDPLLVSVRSGAAVSMPGMMDTVLNVGLNPTTVEALARIAGKRFAWDSYRRFLAMYGQVVMGISGEFFEEVLNEAKARAEVVHDSDLPVGELRRICDKQRVLILTLTNTPVPNDPQEQLTQAIAAVLRSWNSERAQAYRTARHLPDWVGTAVNVQAMVFGNRDDDSATGVVFSHDVTTGQPGLYGEFLVNAQGEDVVAGLRTPQPIDEMKEWAPSLYEELHKYVQMLVEKFDDIVDVEFTIEQGRLFLLQVRRAKRAALAAATFAVHQVWAERWNRERALEAVSLEDATLLRQRPSFDDGALLQAARERLFTKGLAASPGAAIGVVALSSAKAQEWAAEGRDVVLVRRDTSPDDLPGMLNSVAIVTSQGGTTCHAAIVARELGLPAVVGASLNIDVLLEGTILSVDGSSGVAVYGRVPLTQPVQPKEVRLFLRWKAQQRYMPTLRFMATEEEWCVNTMLNDFYLVDAMTQALHGSELATRAIELRSTVHEEIAERLAAYLAYAITSELLFFYGYANSEVVSDAQRILEKEFALKTRSADGDESRTILGTLRGANHEARQRFFECAEVLFRHAIWNHGYGGERWSLIARTMGHFFAGKLTPTTFVDHVFDLRHNGERLFDKHLMVSGKSSEEMLRRQLNIKRDSPDIAQLYAALSSVGRPLQAPGLPTFTFEVFSPAVSLLWRQAVELGIVSERR